MKALVLGYGRSGKAAEALLRAQGYEVVVLDGEETFPCLVVGDSFSRDKNVASPLAAEPPRPLFDTSSPRPPFSFAVVSPGIALTHPWIAACRAHGIPLKSELQLGCEELKRRGWKLLGVTGSKGKSSVVKIVADAITQAGGCGVACGNYGVPVCEVAMRGVVGDFGTRDRNVASPLAVDSWAVVEVSSFMMETTELSSDTFEAATVLNLQEDHLDRHGSVEVYHALKRKLLGMAKEVVGDSFSRDKNVASPLAAEGNVFSRDRNVASPLAAEGSAQESFRAAEPPRPLTALRGSYFDNPVLRENGVRAIGLMRVAGLTENEIASAFRSFEPLPHRMNLVATIDGVRYIDDSKATSLAALAAGVEMASTPSVLLIAGGLPKGDDPKSVLPTLTSRVRKVYLIGQSAELFCSAWSASVDCEVCGTMERAVEAAKRDAASGETVLLSPGTASFDQFKSFGERGEAFVSLIKKGKTE